MRVALLWQRENLGIYSNAEFDYLYKGVGHNNGNLAFVYAIPNQIADKVRFFPWHATPETLKKSADIIVIPCANQLGGHTDLGVNAQRLEQTGLPIVAIGLGAQSRSTADDVSLKQGTVDWVNTIKSRSISSNPNIYARGQYTVDQLSKLGIGNAILGGCPSFFTSPEPDLGQRIWSSWNEKELPRSISVAAGHQAWTATRALEHQLISMMMDPVSPGQYVVQSMSDMIKISRGEFGSIEEKVLNTIHKHTVPHYTMEEFKNWCLNYARSFYDVPSWMDSLRRYDLTVGCRYHGVALALQAGKMGLVLTIDTRTTEMCENTMVPNVPADACKEPLTRQQLKKMIQFDPYAYDRTRAERAARYIAFLEGNQLTPSKYLYAIAGSK